MPCTSDDHATDTGVAITSLLRPLSISRMLLSRFFCALGLLLLAVLAAVVLAAYVTGAFQSQQHALNYDSLPFYHTADFQPRWDKWSSWQRTVKFDLIDQHGEPMSQNMLEKRPSFVGFFYAGCVSLCPVSLEVLRELNRIVVAGGTGVQPQFLLLTVNPELDGAGQLADYAKRLQLPANWSLLTGNSKELERFAHSLKTDIRLRESNGEPVHGGRVFLLDTDRRIRGVYDASSTIELLRMRADFERLSVEMSDQKI
ncbi:SCO family protein [Undibacterium sp. RuTC16W]|uniref:SCO family protein n=1 Tax=Undibacterium sp. RuTC16W TaxID=3413048 RepID=UPI003BF3EEBB